MAETLQGTAALQKRLKAVQQSPRPILAQLQIEAVAEAKRLVPRKTGFLGRSIKRGALVPPVYAIVQATAPYAGYVELGTKPHIIQPRNAKVLAWPASQGGRRLSGSARSGAAMRFARHVHHPGTKPQPFLVPGAIKALESHGWRNIIVTQWNKAA